MTQLSNRYCASGSGKTYMGTSDCPRPLGYIRTALFVEPNTVIAYDDREDLLDKIQALCLEGKALPLVFTDLTANNTAETEWVETGYKDKEKGMEGKPDLTFRLSETDTNFMTYTRALNEGKYDVLLVDEKDTSNGLWGNKTGTAGEIMSIPLDNKDISTIKIQTSSAVHFQECRLMFRDAGALTENVLMEDFKGVANLNDQIKGNKEVQVSLTAGTAGTGIAYMKLICPLDGTNLMNISSAISTILTTASSYTFVNGSGATITPAPTLTASVDSEGQKQVTVAFAASVTATVDLISASALATAGVGGAPSCGYESNGGATVTVTVT